MFLLRPLYLSVWWNLCVMVPGDLMVRNTPANRTLAQDTCASYNGSLVVIKDPEKHSQVVAAMDQPVVWIGLRGRRQNSHEWWYWTDWTRMNYSRWADGEPERGFRKSCVVMKLHSQQWYSARCYREFPFICDVPSTVTDTAEPTTMTEITTASLPPSTSTYSSDTNDDQTFSAKLVSVTLRETTERETTTSTREPLTNSGSTSPGEDQVTSESASLLMIATNSAGLTLGDQSSVGETTSLQDTPIGCPLITSELHVTTDAEKITEYNGPMSTNPPIEDTGSFTEASSEISSSRISNSDSSLAAGDAAGDTTGTVREQPVTTTPQTTSASTNRLSTSDWLIWFAQRTTDPSHHPNDLPSSDEQETVTFTIASETVTFQSEITTHQSDGLPSPDEPEAVTFTTASEPVIGLNKITTHQSNAFPSSDEQQSVTFTTASETVTVWNGLTLQQSNGLLSLEETESDTAPTASESVTPLNKLATSEHQNINDEFPSTIIGGNPPSSGVHHLLPMTRRPLVFSSHPESNPPSLPEDMTISDLRPSAVCIGLFWVLVLVAIITAVVVSDALKLRRQAKKWLKRNIQYGCERIYRI